MPPPAETPHTIKKSRKLGLAGEPIADVLAWAWETVTGPVLDTLGYHRPPRDGQSPPRLWWIPTGPLASLPLHAAGLGPGSPPQRNALDMAISSYAPTIRVLRHVRSRVEPAEHRALVVALPHTPSLPDADLPSAEAEARIVREGFEPHGEVLLGPDATAGRVRAALTRNTCIHFVCHAATDPVDPSRSYFALHDGPITVADLMRMDLTRAHLAYLSACETARTDGPLLDEASHLASACQIAGYPHVIATLWPVRDRIATESARRVYASLPAGRGAIAAAVNDNARRIRARYPDSPELWASHIHLGP